MMAEAKSHFHPQTCGTCGSMDVWCVPCATKELTQKLEDAKAHHEMNLRQIATKASEITSLRNEVQSTKLHLDEAKKALAQYINVFLPSGCPANGLFQPGGIFSEKRKEEPPKPTCCGIGMRWDNREFQSHGWVCDSCKAWKKCDHRCCGGQRS